MIVYFDTVRRKRPVKEGGELVKLDWETKKVLKKMPIFPTEPEVETDPNPRGNSRGGKGIIVTGSEVFVGTYHTILAFDHDLNLKRRITNNLFVNIHEMCLDGDNIWASSTTIDCAIKVNPTGKTIKTWWPREERLLQERYELFPLAIDKQADNRIAHIHEELGQRPSHTHLNCVTKIGDRTFVLLNRLGVLVQIEPELKIIIDDLQIKNSHSAKITPDGKQVAICRSFNHGILFFNLETGQCTKKIDLVGFPGVRDLEKTYPDQPFNKSIFVRGLDFISPTRFLVGISPASILEIDLEKNTLIDMFQHADEVGDAVHGLAHL